MDSSDSSHLNEAAQSLAKVLRNSTLAGLPLLVLANKQDLSDAKDLVEVLKIAITFYSCYLQQYGSKNEQTKPTLIWLGEVSSVIILSPLTIYLFVSN